MKFEEYIYYVFDIKYQYETIISIQV